MTAFSFFFFFFLAVTLPVPCLSVCLSGSCAKKAKAIWQPPPDKREVVEQEGGGGLHKKQGWGRDGGGGEFDLSTSWGLFLGKQPLRNEPKKTGWHTLLDWSEEFVASVLVRIRYN